MSVETNSHNYTNMNLIFSQFLAVEFPKTPSPKPARIPPQTPPAGGKSVEAKRKILFPRKTDFRFAESELKPHHTARILGGQNPKEKCPFHFQEKIHPPQIKKARDIFLWGCWRTRQCVGLAPNHLFWK